MIKVVVLWKREKHEKFHITEFIGFTPSSCIQALGGVELAFFIACSVNKTVKDIINNENKCFAYFSNKKMKIYKKNNFPTIRSMNKNDINEIYLNN